MSGLGPGRQPGEQHLMTLRGELASRGVTCDLRDGGRQPRLPVWYPGASTADEPLDSVAVAFIRGEWWYCWPARQGLPRAQETLVTWPELMSPGRALEGLRVELAARGLATVGMTLTRLQGMLTLAEGPGVGYHCGWLFWPAGRLSIGGRPLYAVHRAGDPAGAARRLALPRAPGRQRESTAVNPGRHSLSVQTRAAATRTPGPPPSTRGPIPRD